MVQQPRPPRLSDSWPPVPRPAFRAARSRSMRFLVNMHSQRPNTHQGSVPLPHTHTSPLGRCIDTHTHTSIVSLVGQRNRIALVYHVRLLVVPLLHVHHLNLQLKGPGRSGHRDRPCDGRGCDCSEHRFRDGQESEAFGQSVAHLGLRMVGPAFCDEMRKLQGVRLGCFCDDAGQKSLSQSSLCWRRRLHRKPPTVKRPRWTWRR